MMRRLLNMNFIGTFFACSYPILNRYASPIPQVTLSEFFVMVLIGGLVLYSIDKNRRIKVCKYVVPFTLWLCVEIFLSYFFMRGEARIDSIGSLLRLFLIYVCIALMNQNLFVRKLGRKMVRAWAILLSLYGLLQIAMANLGVVLSTYLPFLIPFGGEKTIDSVVYEQMYLYGLTFRCRSFMTEPAMLCTYLILALFLELFENKKNSMTWMCAILFTVTCLLSMSSTGIIVCGIVWVSYYFSTIKKGNKISFYRKTIGMLIVLLLSILFIAESGIGQYFLNRTFHGNISIEGIMSSTRFYALQTMFEGSDSISGILVGKGLVETAEYLPGFPRVYYSLGIIGLCALLHIFIKVKRTKNSSVRYLLMIYFIMNIGTEIAVGAFSVIYMAFLINVDEMQMKGIDTTCIVKN